MTTDIESFVNGRGLLEAIHERDFLCMPIVKYVDVTPERELRLLIGGRCSSCGTKFLRNTCNRFFCKQVVAPIILERFPHRIVGIKPVSTHDEDFEHIVQTHVFKVVLQKLLFCRII